MYILRVYAEKIVLFTFTFALPRVNKEDPVIPDGNSRMMHVSPFFGLGPPLCKTWS